MRCDSHIDKTCKKGFSIVTPFLHFDLSFFHVRQLVGVLMAKRVGCGQTKHYFCIITHKHFTTFHTLASAFTLWRRFPLRMWKWTKDLPMELYAKQNIYACWHAMLFGGSAGAQTHTTERAKTFYISFQATVPWLSHPNTIIAQPPYIERAQTFTDTYSHSFRDE